jgi:REP element-mobilizing transposase RayT
VNTFEPASTETEQKEREQKETQTVSPFVTPAPAPELKPEEIPASSSGIAAETISHPSADELVFSCLLIPRFHDHYLAGDITENLVEWMRQVCISYGWRLDAIVVRPGYLQWVMTVPLNANPAQFMRITRRHTSQKIFEDFPRYKNKNLSGEFWAPGNFVVPGNQLLTSETINKFILQTRRNQGIV